MFGDTEIEKHKFHCHKHPISTGILKISVSP